MKIGIDARFTIDNRRGIGNYSLNLINELSKLDKLNDYILYIHKIDSKNILPNKNNFRVKVITCSNYFIWEQFIVPIHLKNDKIDIFHSLGNTSPIFISSGIHQIVTLHDVIFFKKEFSSSSIYQKIGNIYRKYIVHFLYYKNIFWITVSNFSKADIIHTLGKPINDILVTWGSYNKLEIDSNIILTDNSDGNTSFILALGGEDLRKNTMLVVKVFFELRKNGYYGNLRIVGYKKWRESKAFDFVKENGIDKFVEFKDYVSDNELSYLYSNADYFLYPSLYEGFGIPPLEAMSLGCPVVTSNLTSIPEIVGDAGVLINPFDQDEIVKACLRLMEEEGLRQEKITKGFNRVLMFSWTNMAKQTLCHYKYVFDTI